MPIVVIAPPGADRANHSSRQHKRDHRETNLLRVERLGLEVHQVEEDPKHGHSQHGNRILGSDIAGQVQAVGSDVTRFRVGDEVYGDNLGLMGGFAEYALAPESVLAHKPATLTFAEASTLPQAAAIALQGTAGVGAGTRLVVNGAGGGSVAGRVYSFEAGTGELAWSHSTGDWVYSAPAVANTPKSPPTVYIGSMDQTFYALDARDGSVRCVSE
jgi:hypothetical protein